MLEMLAQRKDTWNCQITRTVLSGVPCVLTDFRFNQHTYPLSTVRDVNVIKFHYF